MAGDLPRPVAALLACGILLLAAALIAVRTANTRGEAPVSALSPALATDTP